MAFTGGMCRSMRFVMVAALWAAGCVLVCMPLTAAASSEETSGRRLAWELEPGDVRRHAVGLELDTRLAVRSASEEMVRQTRTELSFDVRSLGLRRASAEEMVIDLTVGDFRLGVTTKGAGSVVEVTMDREGMTVRRDDEPARRAPWASVPPGRGGAVGELIGRPVVCTIDRRGGAVRLDGRMRVLSQVLDSFDLIAFVMPLVPVPDAEVESGSTWTVTSRRGVQLSQPWGKLELGTRTEVQFVGFEASGQDVAARVEFVRVDRPVAPTPHLSYELTVEGSVLVGLDGTVLGGEATVAVAARTTIVDTTYELSGTGTLQLEPGQAAAGVAAGGWHDRAASAAPRTKVIRARLGDRYSILMANDDVQVVPCQSGFSPLGSGLLGTS
jgi:hypothetical protein